MSDVTKCKGIGCAIREQCFRYTAPGNKDKQSYSDFYARENPYPQCEYFWDIKFKVK